MLERITRNVDGWERQYWLVAGTKPTDLVIFLHGMGASALWADAETGWSAFARREGFAVAVPEALPLDPRRPPHFRDNPRRWRDGGSLGMTSVGSRLLESSIPPVSDVQFLDRLMEDCLHQGIASPERVFLCGFSNGAAMVFRMAAERAERIAAIAPVAGYCRLETPRPVRPVPTCYLIGEADPLVPVRGGRIRTPWSQRPVDRPPLAETLECWAGAIGCRPPPRTVHQDADVRIEQYEGSVDYKVLYIKELGHHWPGGAGKFDHRLAGPHHRRFDATAYIWAFFQSVVRRNSRGNDQSTSR